MKQPPDHTDILACARMEREILLWLLERCDDTRDWPWRPIGEVMGSSTEPIAALDAMAALANKGLIRRKGEFVMATSTAYACYQLLTWRSP